MTACEARALTEAAKGKHTGRHAEQVAAVVGHWHKAIEAAAKSGLNRLDGGKVVGSLLVQAPLSAHAAALAWLREEGYAVTTARDVPTLVLEVTW